jgi:tetratricopeptide (TPR) repeat protein
LESLEIKRQLGDKKGISSSLSNLGVIYFEMGLDQKALEHLRQANDLKKELNEIPGIIATVHRAFSLVEPKEQEKLLLEVKALDSATLGAKENCWLLNIELMHGCLNHLPINSQEILNQCNNILELSSQTNLTDIDDLPIESFYWATHKLIEMNQVEEAGILAKQALHWIGIRNTRRKAAFEKITAK